MFTTRQVPKVVRVQLGWGSLWMPQVLGVTVAARPSLSHSLQDEEGEPMLILRPWVSNRQAPLSPGTRTRAGVMLAVVQCSQLSHVSVA